MPYPEVALLRLRVLALFSQQIAKLYEGVGGEGGLGMLVSRPAKPLRGLRRVAGLLVVPAPQIGCLARQPRLLEGGGREVGEPGLVDGGRVNANCR